MARDKIRMPSTQGGLVRYFDDEYASHFIFKPQVIIGAIIALCAIVIGLHMANLF